MELIHQDTVMVLTTGITTSTWVTTMLANTTMSCGNVATLLSVFVKSSRLS
jgi:hypothetical protein